MLEKKKEKISDEVRVIEGKGKVVRRLIIIQNGAVSGAPAFSLKGKDHRKINAGNTDERRRSRGTKKRSGTEFGKNQIQAEDPRISKMKVALRYTMKRI